MVKSADPNETSKCVRRPAARSRSSRSTRGPAPRPAASASRPSTSGHESDGILEASGSTGSLLLGRRDPLDSHRRQLEQLIQALARERLSLGGRLHLDEASLPGHDDVHVDLGTRVFRVVEIDRKSTRLNSSYSQISYAVFCLKKKKSIRRMSASASRIDCSSLPIS